MGVYFMYFISSTIYIIFTQVLKTCDFCFSTREENSYFNLCNLYFGLQKQATRVLNTYKKESVILLLNYRQ